ncbi:MAG: hypothetical protein IJ870_05630 [Alphaproteobacteria bacterium]|nr:hypothetical protein [Alphaproteobacteria bacterium]
MSKFYNALMLTTLLIPCVALGNENSEAQNASSLTANLKRIALQYNQNSVSNREDPNYPGTFTSDEQEVFTGIFDGNIEYSNDSLVWLNSLFMEYGRNESDKNGEKTKSENADKILFTTDYTHKIWKLEEGIVGPFVNLGYQTEFTEFKDAEDGEKYRTKILRGKTGLKLYEGKYFKELYAAAVEEADFTYGNTNMKTAGEIGYKFEYQVRDDMKFVSDGYFRKFFVYDKYRNTDFKYEAETNNRLDVTIVGNLSFAPFVNYKIAKTRAAKKSRSNTTVGLSLGYQTDYKFW